MFLLFIKKKDLMCKDKILVFMEILVVGFCGYIDGWILLMYRDMLKNVDGSFDKKYLWDKN